MIFIYAGIPTSLYNTAFEWDYYNCWPQLQSMVIFGLQSTKSERAKRVAFNFASSWVKTNFVGYGQTKTFFEKVIKTNMIKIKYCNILLKLFRLKISVQRN